MVGQLSNFVKSFDKFRGIINTPGFQDIINFAKEVIGIAKDVKPLFDGITVGYDIFKNLNKLDNPKADSKDKAVNITKAILAPTSLIRIPGIQTIGNALVDTADFLADVSMGKKDMPSFQKNDSNNNAVMNGATKIIQGPVKNFFNKFGF
jgi:hypothetical protein